MRRSSVLWTLSLALAAGAGYWAGASNESRAPGGHPPARMATVPAKGAAATRSAPSTAPTARIEGDWKAAYGCLPPCEGGPKSRQQEHGTAFTLEEAEWLKRNGFPSATDVDALRQLDERQVLARANRGDAIATVVAAQSIINQNGPLDLITPALSREATKGSVAALVLLGAANARKADEALRAGNQQEWRCTAISRCRIICARTCVATIWPADTSRSLRRMGSPPISWRWPIE
jgi:hypothetical protein